jgi:membrane protein implicated in regulation of membrane protease activity
MTQGIETVWQRSLILWIGAAAVTIFNSAAAYLQSQPLAYALLALTAMFALVGVGIWAGRTLARDTGNPDNLRAE